MKAIQIKNFGIDGLHIDEIIRPQLKSNQMLVRVKAASLNYLDLLVVKGVFNPNLPLPHTPLTDVAGVVEQVGSNVSRFQIGDEVIPTFIRLWRRGDADLDALAYHLRPSLGMQGYGAEYIVIEEDDAIRKPGFLSFEEAATLPIASLSAWNGIKYLNLNPGDDILLYGSGGVSTFALMFAKAAGLRVFVATRGNESALEMARLGAYKVYNVTEQSDWQTLLLEETRQKGVKGVYDSVGGSNINNSLSVIGFRGRITVVGLIEGFSMPVNAGTLLWKHAQLIGLECGSTDDLLDVVKAMEINRIKPVISKIYPVAQIREAFSQLGKGGTIGKIVISF